MIVKCKECGNEYELEKGEKISDFLCECGSNLEHRKTINDYIKGQKTTINAKKTTIVVDDVLSLFYRLFHWFKDRNKNEKIIIGIAGLISVILIFYFVGAFILDVTDRQHYTFDNIAFDHPDGWTFEKGDGKYGEIIKGKNIGTYGIATFGIRKNSGENAREKTLILVNIMDELNAELKSQETTTVAGVRAYKIVYKTKLEGLESQNLFFEKNGYTYEIYFMSDNLFGFRRSIDMITKSFQV